MELMYAVIILSRPTIHWMEHSIAARKDGRDKKKAFFPCLAIGYFSPITSHRGVAISSVSDDIGVRCQRGEGMVASGGAIA
jgi:hypothetical protein